MIGQRVHHRDLNMPGKIIGREGCYLRVKYDSLKYPRLELLYKLKVEKKCPIGNTK